MIVQHSSKTDRWFTPPYIIEKAKAVLGDIDLDPASEEAANRWIGASTYYVAEGLDWDWSGTIWLNPPGGKICNKSQALLFWEKLMDTREEGNLTHAIYLAFSITQLQSSQDKPYQSMCSFPLCIPNHRIQFVGGGDQPSHANAIIYVPGRVDLTGAFLEEFSDVGACLLPA